MRPSVSSSNGGFTLVEVLVAITLISILFAVLFGSLHLAADVWTRSDKHRNEAGVIPLSRDFIRRQLRQTRAVQAVTEQGGVPSLAFSGETDTLIFVSPAPNAAEGGNYWHRLSLAEDPGTSGHMYLRLQSKQIDPASEITSFEEHDSDLRETLLANNITELRLSYFGASKLGAPPRWRSVWERTDRLPDMITIETLPVSGWGKLTVSPRAIWPAQPVRRRRG